MRDAQAAKLLIDRLSSRAPAFAIEQAALAGLFGEGGDVARAAARLNLYAEEGDGEWTGEPAVGEGGHGYGPGGYVFSRLRRGVSERIVLDDLLLHSADARKLAERAAALAPTAFAEPASFTRQRTRPARCVGRSTWWPR